MDYNYNTPLYYSFSEFLANYESDFNEWKTFYPDGTERYFLKTIYDKYNKVPYFDELELRTEIDYNDREYIIEEIVRKKTFSDYIILPYFDGIGEYPRNEKVWFYDLAELITARIRFVLNPGLKKGIEVNGMTYNLFPTNNISFDIQNIWDIQDICDRQPTDGYVIDVFKFSSYTPFMEIKKTDNDLGYVYFNEYKYKNFEYTINQILDWIDERASELQNQLTTVITETEPTDLSNQNNPLQPTVKENNTETEKLHSEIFANNGFKLFSYILENHIADKGKRGRYADISFYYWKLYNNTPQYIHQRPEVFKNWFCSLYADSFEKIKTLNEVADKQGNREKHYTTSLDWFKTSAQV